MCDIAAAHQRELDELDDAIVADDNWDRHGSGEVVWVSPDRPLGVTL
jgi:hypothetical protein